MNITFNISNLQDALAGIRQPFRDMILECYMEIKKRQVKSNFTNEYDSAGISSGKFCEITLRFLQSELNDSYISFDHHISNFANEVKKLTDSSKEKGNESLRVIIPRMLLLIYTLRNKRGIGHIGGDISANQIDLSTIVKNIDWVICELIRIYHNLSLEQAQNVIDSLNIKILPDIWEVDGLKRVIREGLSAKQKVLLLLYNEINNVAHYQDLLNNIQYRNISNFKSKVLDVLHSEGAVEYNKTKGLVTISPKGIIEVECIITNQIFKN